MTVRRPQAHSSAPLPLLIFVRGQTTPGSVRFSVFLFFYFWGASQKIKLLKASLTGVHNSPFSL